MIHPVPRGEFGDLIAVLSLVALLVVAMAIAAKAAAWLSPARPAVLPALRDR